jgi:hypothetical protein
MVHAAVLQDQQYFQCQIKINLSEITQLRH